jgi:hypothetical protein
MRVYNTTTGTIDTISIYDRHFGLEWTAEMIGGCGWDGFTKCDRDGAVWQADAGTINWWRNHISNYEAMETAIAAARDAGMPDDDIVTCQACYNDGDEVDGPINVMQELLYVVSDGEYLGRIGMSQDDAETIAAACRDGGAV